MYCIQRGARCCYELTFKKCQRSHFLDCSLHISSITFLSFDIDIGYILITFKAEIDRVCWQNANSKFHICAKIICARFKMQKFIPYCWTKCLWIITRNFTDTFEISELIGISNWLTLKTFTKALYLENSTLHSTHVCSQHWTPVVNCNLP